MNKKIKAALLSVFSNSVLVILKLIIGLITNSVSIISEAIHSGIDLLASIIAFFAVRVSSKPPDYDHQYGHGKFENISGTIEALLIFLAALWIIYEAVRKFFIGGQIESFGLGIAVMGISALFNFLISSYLSKVAKEEDSIALEADALHLRTDVYTSIGVLIGLVLIYITDLYILDSIVAILVALLITKEAWKITRKAFLPLVDTRLSEEEEKKIINVIEKYSSEFIEFHSLRTRKSGSEIHIDLHLVVPKEWSIGKVHNLCNLIEQELKKYNANCYCLIHAEPCYYKEKHIYKCPKKNNCSLKQQNNNYKE